MRIRFLLPRCTLDNSHGRYVIELSRRLSALHNLVIYSGAFWPGLRSIAECRSLPVIQRPLLAKIASLWLESLAVVRSARDEVVHVQGADALVGNIVTAHFCNQAVRPLIRSHGAYYPRFNYAVGAAAEQYSMSRRGVRRVIAVSDVLKNDIVREYAIDPSKVTVVHHGVDLATFHPHKRASLRNEARKAYGIGEEEFAVLFIGGDYRLKGLLPLMEALRGLPHFVKVLVAGVRRDRALSRLLAETRINDRVTFCPRTESVLDLYAAADCFVLPTRYETFSLVTLEAMASGLPVIVSRLAGVSEILTHGDDSLLLDDPANHVELLQCLTGLLTNAVDREHLGVAARHTAEKHPWELVATETLKVYEDALAES